MGCFSDKSNIEKNITPNIKKTNDTENAILKKKNNGENEDDNDDDVERYETGTSYKNGKKGEDGTIRYENGNYYKGEEKGGKRHGKGTEYYKDDEMIIYEGDWIDDLPDGNGKFIDRCGFYYIGQFKKNKLIKNN